MTNPGTGNFSFLENHDRSLYEAATMAEDHLHGDPMACLVRLRQLAEQLCLRLAKRGGLRDLEALRQFDRLELIARRKLMPAPQLAAAHRIRQVGNEAAHRGVDDRDLALARLQDAHALALWYVRDVLGRKDVIPVRFAPPAPPQAASSPEPSGPPDRFAPVRAEQRRLQTTLTDLADIATKGGEDELGKRCSQAAQQLGDHEFTVAVLGEFKAGKTSLINALCGQELLPTATLECTAAVTVIHAATPERADIAVLTRSSGDKEVVPLERLEDSLTVRSTRDAADPTEVADVWLSDVPLLRHGVSLVDTPGLNAAGLARERATLHFLPRADAVVFVTRADQLLTETELTFIRERLLDQNLARLFLVVNYADRLETDEDRADVMRRAHELLDPLVGALRLHTVCAVDALEGLEDDDEELLAQSGVPSFLGALETFLVEQRAQAELGRARKQLQAFRADLSQRLHERRAIATMGGQLAERRRERIKAWMGYARDDEKALIEHLAGRLRALQVGPMKRVCEGSRVRLDERLRALKLDGERVDEREARELVDAVGGQAMTQLQGTCRIETNPGQGTSWYFTFAKSNVSLPCVIVTVGDICFAIPEDYVETFLDYQADRALTIEQKPAYSYNGHVVPIIETAETFDLITDWGENGKHQNMMILKASQGQRALIINEILHHAVLPILPLPKLYRDVPIYLGITMFRNEPVQVVNVETLY